jgi:DNA polymerase elongation subunit (family B)
MDKDKFPPYIKIVTEGIDINHHCVHLWTEDNKYHKIFWDNEAYREIDPNIFKTLDKEKQARGLNGDFLKKTTNWKTKDEDVHWHDMRAHQKWLIENYKSDQISKNQKTLYFDIEIEIGGALTEKYIQDAPKPVTSIAWYYQDPKDCREQWVILILDKDNKLNRTKKNGKNICPFSTEKELLECFLKFIEYIKPDILVGYNSDYFDVPYLYHRMKKLLGKEEVLRLSPVEPESKPFRRKSKIHAKSESFYKDKKTGNWVLNWFDKENFVKIQGIESLDYMRLHKKYSWKDEPSYKLEAIGEKYAGIGKIEYEGTLDTLFRDDIDKFIEYNFRDVEILVKLEKKLKYLELTKNLAHKGRINYSEVYANSRVHDGAISSFLYNESNKTIPPKRPKSSVTKKGYAGGYLFCPKAGVFNYVFDEDLTSLYPSIIMSLNIGKETLIGRIIDPNNDRNNRLGYKDLKTRNPEDIVIFQSTTFSPYKEEYNPKFKKIEEICRFDEYKFPLGKLIEKIESNKYIVAANGTIFRTDKKSVLSTILDKWFNERVHYKNEMKKAYKSGNNILGDEFYMKQYTMKILLNSLYGATALPTWRYGNIMLSEAITLSGQRIIQESALFVNTHMNKRVKC